MKNALDSLTASSLWTNKLLELFWAVDEAAKDVDASLPPVVEKAYESAEAARLRMVESLGVTV